MHDIGILIFAIGMSDRFAKVRALQAETQRPSHELEREEFGVSHAEVGAYLLGYWGLPFQLVELVAFHHTPNVVTSGPIDTLAAVHIADVLSEPGAYQAADPASAGKLDAAFVARAGLTPKLAEWHRMVSGSLVERPVN